MNAARPINAVCTLILSLTAAALPGAQPHHRS